MWYLALSFLPIVIAITLWWLLVQFFRFFEHVNFLLSERIVRSCRNWLAKLPARLMRTFRRMRRRSQGFGRMYIRVFLSSTQIDLRLERLLARWELSGDYDVICMEWDDRRRTKNVEASGFTPNSMERYASDWKDAEGWSRAGVESSDIVVYLMGRRFGSMTMTFFSFRPYSLTELELQWATAADVPILMYRLKYPLDDDAELRRQYDFMEDSVAQTEFRTREMMTDMQQLALVSLARGSFTLPENVEEITSFAELVRRVRQDVDAIAAKIARQILALQAALFALGAWFAGCLLWGIVLVPLVQSTPGFPQNACPLTGLLLTFLFSSIGLVLLAVGFVHALSGKLESARELMGGGLLWILLAVGAAVVTSFGARELASCAGTS